MARFAVLFGVLVLVLFTAELTPPVQRALVMPWTALLARICAWLVALVDPHVVAYGNVLQESRNGFAISIEAGCNGVEAMLILAAAIVAYRARWAAKAAGILLGALAVQALNVVRVVSLFFLGQWSLRAFEWAHLYAWQALIMLDVLVAWLVWLRWTASTAPKHADATR